MHILLIIPQLIDTHTHRFLQMLLNAGYKVTCVGKENPKPDGDIRYAFIQYPELYITKRIFSQRLRRTVRDWGIAVRLRLIYFRVKPDVVHVIYINLQAYYCALARLSPLVLTALGSDINNLFHSEYDEHKRKIVKTLSVANHITADTYEILQRCETLVGRPLNKSLFYFGIDFNLFYPRSSHEKLAFRKELSIPISSKIVLSPRRLNSTMNHDVILESFAEIMKDKNVDAILLFRKFGFYSIEYQKKLEDLAENLGIAKKVIWLEEMDYSQIPILYSISDVIINIPEQDGLPVTLFEASACKVPIITSNIPAYEEFLSGISYFRVSNGNRSEIEEWLRKVLFNDIDEIKTSLQRNYDWAFERASQEKCFANIEKVYREV